MYVIKDFEDSDDDEDVNDVDDDDKDNDIDDDDEDDGDYDDDEEDDNSDLDESKTSNSKQCEYLKSNIILFYFIIIIHDGFNQFINILFTV